MLNPDEFFGRVAGPKNSSGFSISSISGFSISLVHANHRAVLGRALTHRLPAPLRSR